MTETVLQKRCDACGRVYYSWGAHAEECTGPRPEPECDCPPGMRHEPGCDLAYWPEDAA